MSDDLTIDFKWMGGQWGNQFDQAFAAEIGVKLGENWLTELEEFETRTTMTHVRACTHTLARWFAGNWWRLRWEPVTRNASQDPDWRTTHSMANAGEGFAWPNIVFASDGESLAVASSPRLKAESHEPLRYLNAAQGRITAKEFETKVDGFLNAVISRHSAMGIDDKELPRLWSEVLEERKNPQMTRWRKLEALCGYDPDEAPESIIELLATDKYGLGKQAMEEVAAHGRHDAAKDIEAILQLAESRAAPASGGFRCNPPELKRKPRYVRASKPWQKAAKLAQSARREWDLGNEPISNAKLCELLGIPKKALEDRATKASTPMPFSIRDERSKTFVYFNSAWSTSRKFAACRLLGQWLEQGTNAERLVPSTEAKTVNQQFQRAFAQEFLCPFDMLKDHLPSESPSLEDIQDVANHFGVSPLVISTTLVNKGELDREALGEYA